MSDKKTLVQDTILYAIANFGTVGLNFLLLPFYTRYFTPEQFGTWDITLTTISLLIPIVTLELTSASYRWLIEENNFKQQAVIITTAFLQIIKQLVVINLISLILLSFWTFPYKWLALIFLNAAIITNFSLQCARALRYNLMFASLSLLQTLIIIVVNVTLLLEYQFGIEAFFYANIAACLIISTIIWFRLPLGQYIRWKKLNYSSRSLLKDYFNYALPIIPAAISWWVMTMSDRWIIAIFLGVSTNGIYAIALKIPAVLLMINTIFSLAWKDSAIRSFKSKQKNEYYSLVFKYYFRLLSLAVIILTLIAKPVINYFIGQAYHEAWKYSGILLIAALFHSLALFWSAGFHGAKETKAILRSSIVGACINVIINVLFINLIGLYAVAISTLLAFFITWIMRVKEAKSHFTIKINMVEVSLFVGGMIVANGLMYLL